jgi:hypothetical protein
MTKLKISLQIANTFKILIKITFFGFFLDLLFLAIGDYTGTFSEAINILNFFAPGLLDPLKLFLNLFYAIIYILCSKHKLFFQ